MPKPPTKKPTHDDLVQTKVRLPREIYAELQAEAASKGQSLNDEILQRLQLHQHQAVIAELADVKAMLRKLIEMT